MVGRESAVVLCEDLESSDDDDGDGDDDERLEYAEEKSGARPSLPLSYISRTCRAFKVMLPVHDNRG